MFPFFFRLPLPGLTAWFGDENTDYNYSGILMKPERWTAPLLSIKDRVEAASNLRFNSVLFNLYRGGSDSVSWHQDNEKELGHILR